MLALAVLVKPQPLVIAPLLLVWQFRADPAPARLLLAPIGGFAVAYLGSLPFAPSAYPLATLSWLAQRYQTAVQLYPFTSVSAFNLYTVADGFFESDQKHVLGFALSTWGLAAFLALLASLSIAFAAFLFAEPHSTAREQALYTASFIALAGLFMLTTRMHERYLFAALTLVPLLWLRGRWSRVVAATMVGTFTVNCVLVLSLLTEGVYHRGINPLIHALSLLNVGCLTTVTLMFFRESALAWMRRRTPASVPRDVP